MQTPSIKRLLGLDKVKTKEEVEQAIEDWHESDEDVPLYEWLGWSWEEYVDYVERGVLPSD